MTASPAPFDKSRRASDDDRERVVAVLLDAMTSGRLRPEEFDARVGSAYRAATLGELEPVVADLSVDVGTLVSPVDTDRTPQLDPRIGGKPGSHVSVAVLGSVERSGGWVLPVAHTSFSYLGNVTLDLREARFARRRSTIVVLAVLGSIRVIVPPDIGVRTDGFGVVGNFSGPSVQEEPGAPVVRVTGLALWGEVVVVREPRKEQPEETG